MKIKSFIGTLVPSLLVKKLGLDYMYASTIAVTLSEAFDEFNLSFLDVNNFNIDIFYYFIGICGFLISVILVYMKIKKDEYTSLTFGQNDGAKIYELIEYIIENPLFFEKVNFISTTEFKNIIGNIFDDDRRIRFKDTRFNVEGFITSNTVIENKSYKDNKGDTITNIVKYKYVKISLKNKDFKDIIKYYNDIEAELKKKRLSNKIIILNYLKVTQFDLDGTICSKLYSGNKNDKEKRVKENIDTYFSSSKNIIWNTLKNIQYNPEYYFRNGQVPEKKYLLYGPPGTGKSTFARRVAISLERDLVSFSIADFVDNKKELFSMLSEVLPHKNINGNTLYSDPKKTVFIMEEFDFALKFLVEREKDRKKIKEKKMEDGKTVLILNDDYKNKLCLSDLLELFSSPSPVNQLILFATTNNFDYIQKTLPALTRDGRLTPVHIDYIDWDSYKDCVNHFFNKKTKLQTFKIKIPTSKIIDLAMTYQNEKNGFSKFEKEFVQKNKTLSS